ncbi:potassium-transporting ATPase subunit KdpA [Facilibium subflavum]|uniref:potassium-transporting ATPase subunit KdpA n=1 Tax=Facilibium subflavum TaxID=2219058 RepID=UPI000E657F39|nr:potassium-transporting ATPase subunit KdpA [Facilibium subflavum]
MYQNYLLFIGFVAVIILLTKPLGNYIFNVYQGNKTCLDWFAQPLENLYKKVLGINLKKEQTAMAYLISVLLFSLMCFLFLFAILRLQAYLPFNPANIGSMSWDQAFNTAISFVTNTNWQSYSGETSVSYFAQMVGLSVQNFVSAAVGISVCIALIRGIARFEEKTIGNFWHDLGRAVFWLLLPLCIVITLIYIFQGVPQNLMAYVHAHTLAGGEQIIPQGPIASQEAIKSLGTNGGGFFNANSAHPYENPSIITNFIQAMSIFAIAAALTYTFGKWVKNTRQGWFILIVMGVLFLISLSVMTTAELYTIKPHMYPDLSDIYGQTHHLSNMEGKEMRFGICHSTLYNTVSTTASDGGINSVVDSYTPIGGGIALLNMALGEVIIGGVGAGLYGFLMFMILAVFIASLMIGRIPSFLGKRIQGAEMKWVMVALLISPFCVLIFTGIACTLPGIYESLSNSGAHGFSEILYAYTSAANNNGSAFAGLNANTPFLNITTGIAMLLGRFVTLGAVVVLAGKLVIKNQVSGDSTYTGLSTTSFLFGVLLLFTILIIGGLTIFPALSLGPVLDHLTISQVF